MGDVGPHGLDVGVLGRPGERDAVDRLLPELAGRHDPVQAVDHDPAGLQHHDRGQVVEAGGQRGDVVAVAGVRRAGQREAQPATA